MSHIHRKHLGPYELKRVIGQGGMGTVYEGFDPRLGRRVAIKTLRPDLFEAGDTGFHDRFIKEARMAAALSHPNIVTIHDVGEEDRRIYIVMEFIEGPNLKERLAQPPPPKLRAILDTAIAICEGLHHAHEKELVHRDMKPANVLLGPDHAKIADFGVAYRGDATLGTADALLGTPHYMSPEQYDSAHVDRRSDIFSAGVTLYEALTGRLPFDGETPAVVMRRILTFTPKSPSEFLEVVPGALSEVVMKALAKEPAERFQTAREFADALRQVSGTVTGEVLDGGRVRVADKGTARMQVSPFAADRTHARATPREMHSPLVVPSDSEPAAEWNLTLPIIIVVLILCAISVGFALVMVWPGS